MRVSQTVLLLAAWACLAVSHTEERMERSVSASRMAQLRSRRMVGGTLAPSVPWQVMVYLSDGVLDGGYAGGALISDRWVLTAGRNLFVRKSRDHIQGKEPIIPKVYLGILHRDQAKASTEVAVEKIFLHPGFQNHSDWDNDLALIQLKEPVVMSDKVTPIPLPEMGQNLTDTWSGVISGWGWGVYLNAAASLKFLILPLVDNSYCKAEYEGDALTPDVDDNMLCTGAREFGENVCFGDAGGALAVKDTKTGDIYAAGILSYDKPCRNNKPLTRGQRRRIRKCAVLENKKYILLFNLEVFIII
uniref:Peptidase S1 domain-containing protein n=1 Tax=Scophthalmus maximus TaxID=52904 RepID=A0A8D3CHS9_SCOMX